MTAIPSSSPPADGPRVLVVIPTLGQRLDTLERAVASVRSQAGAQVDLVVVAKTASEQLSRTAASYGARLIEHPGHISAAVNAGIAQAGAEHRYLAWLGDDDMLRPEALATAAGLLDRDPKAVVAYGACDYINFAGKQLFSRRPPPLAPVLLQMVPGQIKQEACLFRLAAVQSVGGLDESLRYAMDLDLLLRLRRLGRFVRTDRPLAAFCWHPNSITIANRRSSLAEAQGIQSRLSGGVVRLTRPLWMLPVRLLTLVMNWHVNRRFARLAEGV